MCALFAQGGYLLKQDTGSTNLITHAGQPPAILINVRFCTKCVVAGAKGSHHSPLEITIYNLLFADSHENDMGMNSAVNVEKARSEETARAEEGRRSKNGSRQFGEPARS